MTQLSNTDNLLVKSKWTSRRFILVVAGLVISALQLRFGDIDQSGYITLIGLIVVPYIGFGTYQNVQDKKNSNTDTDVTITSSTRVAKESSDVSN